eukprot:4553061-Amphidinium_carterae.1
MAKIDSTRGIACRKLRALTLQVHWAHVEPPTQRIWKMGESNDPNLALFLEARTACTRNVVEGGCDGGYVGRRAITMGTKAASHSIKRGRLNSCMVSRAHSRANASATRLSESVLPLH